MTLTVRALIVRALNAMESASVASAAGTAMISCRL